MIGGIGCTGDSKESSICEVGETRCDGNMLQRCNADGWADRDDCAVLAMDCSTLNGEAQCVATGEEDSEENGESDGDTDKEENFIEGSLVENYNIEYVSVRVRLYSESLSVEYLSDDNVAALRVTIDTSELLLAEGNTYDLSEYGTVTRYGDYGELPPLESGELTLDAYSGNDSETVSGTFHAKLTPDSGDSQTLNGAFKTNLEVIPL